MKALLSLALLASLAALSSAQTTFANQTLAVVAVGDDGATLSPQGNQLSLRNYAKSGAGQSPLATVLLPIYTSTGTNAQARLNSDGSSPFKLTVSGYASVAASGTPAGSTTIARRVAQFDAATGAVTYADLGSAYSGAAFYSAQIVGNTLYTAGGAGGVGYLSGTYNGGTNGGQASLTPVSGLAATTGISAILLNLGGTLYAGSYQNGAGDVVALSGGGAGTSIFGGNATGLSGVAPTDFVFTDANTLYMATGAGLYRATRTGGAGAFDTATKVGSITGLFDLAWDGTTLFGTTAQIRNNALLSINPADGSFVTLATSGNNNAFRGVEVVPEPATLAALGLGTAALLRRRRRSA